MLQLYVIPFELHKRVVDADPNLYRGLGDAEKVSELFSLTDQTEMCLSRKRFTFQFEECLPITMGRTPVEIYSANPEYASLAERLSWQIILEEKKHPDKDNATYIYELYPIAGDAWVVVEQRVHEVPSHLKNPSIGLNREFFSKLIGYVYNDMPFHELASTDLFTLYLEASKANLAQ